MPDRGMWNMIEFKRCSGHHGYWVCGEDYPDHMVTVGEFNAVATTKSGLDSRCRRCLKYRNSSSNSKNNPMSNAVSARAYVIAGGLKAFYELPKVERHEIRKTARNEAIKAHLLNTEPDGEVVLAHIERMKSEFGQSKPMTKRTISKIEGERVPEGWVYVVRNPDVPSILKIGKTFPDGIPDIMSSARRFGRAELVAKYEFNEAYKAEQSIHKRLERHNLRTLGYKDCGKELFQCDEMVAIFAILAEGPVLDDDEDAA